MESTAKVNIGEWVAQSRGHIQKPKFCTLTQGPQNQPHIQFHNKNKYDWSIGTNHSHRTHRFPWFLDSMDFTRHIHPICIDPMVE